VLEGETRARIKHFQEAQKAAAGAQPPVLWREAHPASEKIFSGHPHTLETAPLVCELSLQAQTLTLVFHSSEAVTKPNEAQTLAPG